LHFTLRLARLVLVSCWSKNRPKSPREEGPCEDFGCRPERGWACDLGGRRPKASKGGNRGPISQGQETYADFKGRALARHVAQRMSQMRDRHCRWRDGRPSSGRVGGSKSARRGYDHHDWPSAAATGEEEPVTKPFGIPGS
jgi:hypothetical protein